MESKNTFKTKVKKFIIFAFVILIISGSVLGYFKYLEFEELQNYTNELETQNVQLLEQVDYYKQLKNNLILEIKNCEELVIREEGVFSEFTYCQRFLEFSKNIDKFLE